MNSMIKMTLPFCLLVQLTACKESGSNNLVIDQTVNATPQSSVQVLSEASPLGNVDKTTKTVLQKTTAASFVAPSLSIKPPQRIRYQIVDGSKVLKWDAVAGATNYNIYVGGTNLSDFRIISTIFSQELLEYSLSEIVGGEYTSAYITTVSYGLESGPSVIASLSADQVSKKEDIVLF